MIIKIIEKLVGFSLALYYCTIFSSETWQWQKNLQTQKSLYGVENLINMESFYLFTSSVLYILKLLLT